MTKKTWVVAGIVVFAVVVAGGIFFMKLPLAKAAQVPCPPQLTDGGDPDCGVVIDPNPQPATASAASCSDGKTGCGLVGSGTELPFYPSMTTVVSMFGTQASISGGDVNQRCASNGTDASDLGTWTISSNGSWHCNRTQGSVPVGQVTDPSGYYKLQFYPNTPATVFFGNVDDAGSVAAGSYGYSWPGNGCHSAGGANAGSATLSPGDQILVTDTNQCTPNGTGQWGGAGAWVGNMNATECYTAAYFSSNGQGTRGGYHPDPTTAGTCDPDNVVTPPASPAGPQLALSESNSQLIKDSVTAPTTHGMSVMNVSTGTAMNWRCIINPGSDGTFASSGDCGNTSVSLQSKPAWVNVAFGDGTLATSSAQGVSMSFNHSRVNRVGVSLQGSVTFQCLNQVGNSSTCVGPPSQSDTLNYEVPAPTIGSFGLPAGVPSIQTGQAPTLAFTVSNYNTGANIAHAICWNGSDGFSGCVPPASLPADGGQYTGTFTSDTKTATSPVTYTLTVTGLSDQSNATGNVATSTFVVAPTAPPAVTLACSVDQTSVTQTSANQGESFNFTVSGDSGVTAYTWTAPDGTHTSGNIKRYTYTTTLPGQSLVSVTSADGGFAICPTVNVVAPPLIPSISYSLTDTTKGITVSNATTNPTFTDTDNFTLSVMGSNIPSGTSFKLWSIFNGGAASNWIYGPLSGTISNTSYSKTGQWNGPSPTTDGNWQEWVEVDSTSSVPAIVTSTPVRFTLAAATSTVITGGGGGGTSFSCTVLANPMSLGAPGETTTISWSSTPNSGTCSASNAWTGTRSGSGSITPSLTTNSEFDMKCVDPNSGSSNTWVNCAPATVTVGSQRYSCTGPNGSCVFDPSGSYADANCDDQCTGWPPLSCSASPASPTTASQVTFTASGGAGDGTYSFSIPGITGSSSAASNNWLGVLTSTIVGLFPTPGTYTANVTSYDASAGDNLPQESCSVTVTGTGTTITSVSVSPSTASVASGATQSFTPTVSGQGNFSHAVTWSVNGVAGGNATVGTISNSGSYTAPATVPNPATVTVTATSVQDATRSGSATVTVTGPLVACVTDVCTGATKPNYYYYPALDKMISAYCLAQYDDCNNPPYLIGGTNYWFRQNGKDLTCLNLQSPVPVCQMVTSVAVSPSAPSILVGATQQFAAVVGGTGSPTQAVTWSTTAGSITSGGLFTAPDTAGGITVTATSTQDTTKSGAAAVTVNNLPVATNAAAACTVPGTSATFSWTAPAGRGTQYDHFWVSARDETLCPGGHLPSGGGVCPGTDFYNNYTVTSPSITLPQNMATIGDNFVAWVTTRNDTLGTLGENSPVVGSEVAYYGCTVNPTITSVSVSPSPVSVQVGAQQQFAATVQGTGNFNQAVTWAVNNIAGGNATVGTISNAGLYTAPASVPNPATVTVKATSQGDATKNDTASVTVNPASAITSVSVSPNPVSVQVGATQSFTPTVSGQGNFSHAVTWSVNGVAGGNATVGTISNSGSYTAPATVPNPATVTVTATSVQDATQSGSATVTVTASTSCTQATYSPSTSGIYNQAGTQKITTIGTNTSYTVECDYGVMTQNIPPPANCSWPGINNGYIGTAATFACTSPSTAQTVPMNCHLNNVPSGDHLCTSTDAIGSLAVTSSPASSISSVVVSPSPVSVQVGATQSFTPTVSGQGNFSHAVTWSVNGVAGGNATVGTISNSGSYTAPATVPNPATVTVTATSVQDATQSGSATVTVTPQPIFSVTLMATPASGQAPLSSSLKADVQTSDSADTLNYSLWWDCNYAGNDVAGATASCGSLPSQSGCWYNQYGMKCEGVASTSEMIQNTYDPAGTYNPKVIVEQGSFSPVTASASVVASTNSCHYEAFNSNTSGIYNAAGTQRITSIGTNASFTLKCDFGVPAVGEMYESGCVPNNTLDMTGTWNGTVESFDCTSPPFNGNLQGQSVQVGCSLADNRAGDDYCPNPVTVGTLLVSDTPVVNNVTISPSTVSVPLNGTQQFTAVVSASNGTPSQAVIWHASVGSISPTGLFTAPSSGSQAMISAQSQANPTITVWAIANLVAPPSPPTLSFQVAPSTVTFGNSANATWSSTGATLCVASAVPSEGDWTGTKSTNSTVSGQPVTPSSTGVTSQQYSLTCTGPGGSVARSATLSVNPPAQISCSPITANPAIVTPPVQSTLSWHCVNADSCTVNGQPASMVTVGNNSTGTVSVAPTSTTQYALNCVGPHGWASSISTVVVTVKGGGVIEINPQ